MYQKTTLDNGLRVITSHMPHTHSVCIAIFVNIGSRYESEDEAGTSHFIEHLLFRGTQNRPTPREISEAIEGVGGMLNGATDKELTFYWCKVSKDHFRDAADVLADMLRNSRFNLEDIEKERHVIIEEINMCKDSPSQQVALLIDELLWPQQPLGRDIAGMKETVSLIDRPKLLSYFGARYTPECTVVTVTGNIEHQEVLEVIARLLGSWSIHRPRPIYLAYRDIPGERIMIEKRDTEQAHLCLALPGISILDPRRFALDLLNVVLGEGMSSRLFSEIRDKLGLAYSISSYVDHFLDTGSLTISASVDPANLNRAIAAILTQLELLKDGIPEAEMHKAREISKGRLLLRMEDSRNVAGWLGGQEVLIERILTLDQVISIINSITADQLRKIAQELILIDKYKLAVVGPVSVNSTLKEMLKI